MKILALIGSPRPGSNTDLLIDVIIEGASPELHSTEKIYLYDYQILPCIDCRKCKKDRFTCSLKDDMNTLYPKLEASDLVIFGTPNYWYGPSAQMKLLIDRLRPYAENKKLSGKKAILVIPAAEGPDACAPMVQMFRMSLDYLEMAYLGHILGTAYEKAEIKNDKHSLKNAYALGRSLSSLEEI